MRVCLFVSALGMAERWIFTKEQLQNTPSRQNGIDYAKELAYRQQAANLIQDMGQRLQVNQLCINTAIVYMHRFYMFQSFTRFHRNVMAPACLFLAAKVEEQLRKLEHVIRVARTCLNREAPPLDTKSEAYLEQAQELVVNENILLQSLGFDIQVDHPHTHVVKTCQLVRASKDLAQTSYFLATNSLHLTAMCLQYKPTIVACVCIHLASKWSEYEIALSHEGKQWYSYVDKTVTPELLAGLTQEFLDILESCPLRLKKKILTWKSGSRGEDDGPPEKRHKGESSSGSSTHQGQSASHHDRHGGETSSKADRKSEGISKGHRSDPATVLMSEMAKMPSNEENPFKQSVQTPVRKSVSDTTSNKSMGHSSMTLSSDSVDSEKKPAEPQQKAMSFKDYKSYREHKEKQAAAAGHPVTSAAPQHDTERKSHHSTPGAEAHRKHRHQHGSSSSGDEKKSRREHEKRSHAEEGHRKKEREESLKVHIKKESGTHRVKPSDSPLKLKIKSISSESSPSKSHDKSLEPLKMKLSLKTGQSSSHGERPSKHRRSDSYSSHTSGTNPPEMHNMPSSKHSHSSRAPSTGVDGNGVHDAGRSNSRHSNSHHKGAEHHSRAGHQANMSFPGVERAASGSIFSPPPVHQNFDANIFDTGAMMLSQTTAGGQRVNPNVSTAGFGSYHQQSNMSSNFNNSYSNYFPEMFNMGDGGGAMHGLETNGSGVSSLSTKEGLQQLQSNMQQLIGQTKSQIHQMQMQQQQGGQFNFMGMQAYQTNPPLPRAPPPPPPPPEEPPQPPPPPPSN